MPKKSSDDLSRPGEPQQRTKAGLTIPVPTRDEFFGLLDKAAKKRVEPSRSAKGKRRTSRDQ
jgi:hypothetical protein